MDFTELRKKYELLDEESLLEAYLNREQYNPGALSVIDQLIEEKGGPKSIQERITFQQLMEEDSEKLRKYVFDQLFEKNDKDEVRKALQSDYLQEVELDALFEKEYNRWVQWEEDKKSSPASVMKGILGAFIGGTIGGIIWGMMIIGSGKIFFILGLGLFLCCYGFIWLFSRKPMINLGTLILTILSVGYALILGQILVAIFGVASALGSK